MAIGNIRNENAAGFNFEQDLHTILYQGSESESTLVAIERYCLDHQELNNQRMMETAARREHLDEATKKGSGLGVALRSMWQIEPDSVRFY